MTPLLRILRIAHSFERVLDEVWTARGDSSSKNARKTSQGNSPDMAQSSLEMGDPILQLRLLPIYSIDLSSAWEFATAT
jgi:hypothetical protein